MKKSETFVCLASFFLLVQFFVTCDVRFKIISDVEMSLSIWIQIRDELTELIGVFDD